MTRARTHAAILLAVWISAALASLRYIDLGWWPNNGGAFGLSAERVLAGELPHRDFDEIYTGGVAFAHALGFKLLGVSMAAMRRVFFVFFLAWIPAVYYVATRFAGAAVAGLATFMAALWSVCIYTEPIASLYNLVFATFGLACLLRWFETERRRWLVLLGACAGLSILAKIVGIYLLIAACAALLFREQTRAREAPGPAEGGERRLASTYRAFVVSIAIAGSAGLAAAVFRWHGAAGLVHFVLPVAILSAVLVRNEFVGPLRSAASRFREHARLLAPVALGLLVVLGPFLAPYAMTGSLGDLAHGVFVAPGRRLAFAVKAPGMISWPALPVVLTLAWAPRWPRLAARLLACAMAAAAAAWALVCQRDSLESGLIDSVRAIAPVAVAVGCFQILFRVSRDDHRPTAAFAAMAVCGFCSLVQFPVAEPVYFVFIAPLALMAALAAYDERSRASRAPLAVALLACLVLGVVVIEHVHERDTTKLAIDRAGGILVERRDAEQYELLVTAVRTLAAKDEPIFATPDCPEVYFLSGRRNPTRTLYEFFDEPEGRVPRIKEMLAREQIRVVVLNHTPQFSGAPPMELVEHLREAYPRSAVIGAFEVRWRP